MDWKKCVRVVVVDVERGYDGGQRIELGGEEKGEGSVIPSYCDQ